MMEQFTERRKRDEVRMPRWAFLLVISTLIQLAFIVYQSGQFTQRITDLSERMSRVESQIDQWSMKNR